MTRVDRMPGAHEVPIVPVLWDPPTGSWPWIPAPLVHPADPATDARYSTSGLYGLQQLMAPGVKDTEATRDYRTILDIVTGRIVQLARAIPLPSDLPLRLDGAANAFERPATRRLDVYLLAPTRTRVPSGRELDQYGETATDWNPYQKESGTTLARHAEELARKLGYAPRVSTFAASADEVLGGRAPTAPAVLVIDPWALDDEAWRAQLAAFDRLRRPWVGIVAAWNPADAQTAAATTRLRAQLDDTLTRRFKNRRLALHLDAGIASTLGDFATALSNVVTEAAIQYLHTPAATATDPPSPNRTDPEAVDDP
jgi:FxsC-like protein